MNDEERESAAPEAAPSVAPPDLQGILSFLRAMRGFDASGYKPNYLRRRVGVRMRIRSARGMPEYLRVLRHDRAEADSLMAELTVNVTEFLRDPAVFGVFQSEVIPALSAHGGASEIRVWSAGCSTGEEPYSIALCLREALAASGSRRAFSVWATDIDAHVLRIAQVGEYPEKAVRAVPPAWVDRYFERRGPRIAVQAALRTPVRFERFDLLSQRPGRTFDAIFCRNVLIYFLREAQDRVLENLTGALRPGGFLVLGKTESLFASLRERYDAVSLRERVFRRRGFLDPSGGAPLSSGTP